MNEQCRIRAVMQKQQAQYGMGAGCQCSHRRHLGRSEGDTFLRYTAETHVLLCVLRIWPAGHFGILYNNAGCAATHISWS